MKIENKIEIAFIIVIGIQIVIITMMLLKITGTSLSFPITSQTEENKYITRHMYFETNTTNYLTCKLIDTREIKISNCSFRIWIDVPYLEREIDRIEITYDIKVRAIPFTDCANSPEVVADNNGIYREADCEWARTDIMDIYKTGFDRYSGFFPISFLPKIMSDLNLTETK